jgi:hypothetical protein
MKVWTGLIWPRTESREVVFFLYTVLKLRFPQKPGISCPAEKLSDI